MCRPPNNAKKGAKPEPSSYQAHRDSLCDRVGGPVRQNHTLLMNYKSQSTEFNELGDSRFKASLLHAWPLASGTRNT
jgi:hypothetical protein